jgi:antitoxin Phd
MRVVTYSEARQNFASILDHAKEEEIIVTRKDGSRFRISCIEEQPHGSPFDIESCGVELDLTTILSALQDSRERI